MKKYILILLFFIIVPLNVFASEYEVNEDMSLDIDDSVWYVFTRDNLSNNPELDELGISLNSINNYMKKNDVYLYAAMYYKDSSDIDLEFTIEIFPSDLELDDLHCFSKEEVMDKVKDIKKQKNEISDYGLYDNDYSFIELNTKNEDENAYKFITIINGNNYIFSLIKKNEITDSEKLDMKEIIDTIYFDVKNSCSNNYSSMNLTFGTFALVILILFGVSLLLCLITMFFVKIILYRDSCKRRNNSIVHNNEKKIVVCSNCGCLTFKRVKHCPKCGKEVKNEKK